LQANDGDDLRGYDVSWRGRPERPASRELCGTIVFLDYEKKFGFFRPDGSRRTDDRRGPDDVMFHISGAADYNRESATFDMLSRGTRLAGVIRATFRGDRLENYAAIDA
jgi:hypothetical protein